MENSVAPSVVICIVVEGSGLCVSVTVTVSVGSVVFIVVTSNVDVTL